MENLKNRTKDLRTLRDEIIVNGADTIRDATIELNEKYADYPQNKCTKKLRKELHKAEEDALKELIECGHNVTDVTNNLPKQVKKELKDRLKNECKKLPMKKALRCILIIAEEVEANANAQLDTLEEQLRACEGIVTRYVNETIPAFELRYQECLGLTTTTSTTTTEDPNC